MLSGRNGGSGRADIASASNGRSYVVSRSGFSIRVDGDARNGIQSIATDRHCGQVRLY
jgi:hypothetical protein